MAATSAGTDDAIDTRCHSLVGRSSGARPHWVKDRRSTCRTGRFRRRSRYRFRRSHLELPAALVGAAAGTRCRRRPATDPGALRYGNRGRIRRRDGDRGRCWSRIGCRGRRRLWPLWPLRQMNIHFRSVWVSNLDRRCAPLAVWTVTDLGLVGPPTRLYRGREGSRSRSPSLLVESPNRFRRGSVFTHSCLPGGRGSTTRCTSWAYAPKMHPHPAPL